MKSLMVLSTFALSCFFVHGQNPCSILAREGIFEYTQSTSEEDSFRKTIEWLYKSSISSHEELKQIGLDLGIPLEGIPVSFGFSSDSYNYSYFKREMARFLNESDYHFARKVYNARTANVELARVIANCDGVNAFIVRRGDEDVSLRLTFNPAHDGQTYFKLKDLQITPADAAEIQLPDCSINGRTKLPFKIGVSGCNIPITWMNPEKGFQVVVNTNYRADFDLFVGPQAVDPVDTFSNTFLRIQTKTGARKHNNTDEVIKILVVGETGQYIHERLNNAGVNDFEKGAHNTFTILSDKFDIGRIKSVEFSISDGKDFDKVIDDWFIDSFTIRDVNRTIEYSKRVNKYIGDGSGAKSSIVFSFDLPVDQSL